MKDKAGKSVTMPTRPRKSTPPTSRLVCLSDTHGLHRQVEVPDGDFLIHAGDITSFFQPMERSMEMLKDFNLWLGELPHRHKIVIAGNHDLVFQDEPKKARTLLTNAHYLENSGVELGGIRFWGSPITPVMESMAFAKHGVASSKVWSRIPNHTDVLITHGPPYGILDQPAPWARHQGDMELLLAIRKLSFQMHIFGHNHGGFGKETNRVGQWFINCAMVNAERVITHKPILAEIEPREPASGKSPG